MRRRDRLRIAGETGCDPRTISRWVADKDGVSPGIAYALEMACERLGIAKPERGDDQPETGAA